MQNLLRVGQRVKMNHKYLATLPPHDRKEVAAQTYTITYIRTMGDTVLVDMEDEAGKTISTTSASWLKSAA